jgi:hypothetical protein
VSRRRPRGGGGRGEAAGGRPGGAAGGRSGAAGGRPEAGLGARPLGFLTKLVVLALAFGIGVGVAELAGAANLGTAFGIGQIVFAITLVALLLRA